MTTWLVIPVAIIVVVAICFVQIASQKIGKELINWPCSFWLRLKYYRQWLHIQYILPNDLCVYTVYVRSLSFILMEMDLLHVWQIQKKKSIKLKLSTCQSNRRAKFNKLFDYTSCSRRGAHFWLQFDAHPWHPALFVAIFLTFIKINELFYLHKKKPQYFFIITCWTCKTSNPHYMDCPFHTQFRCTKKWREISSIFVQSTGNMLEVVIEWGHHSRKPFKMDIMILMIIVYAIIVARKLLHLYIHNLVGNILFFFSPACFIAVLRLCDWVFVCKCNRKWQ